MKLDELVEKFEGAKRSGHGYTVRCPVHDDKTASLTIHEEEDKLLLHCQAGCNTEDVINAVGVQWRDLWTKARDYAEPEEIYEYVDAAGTKLYEVVRLPGKSFRQRHWEDDQWVWNMDGIQRVLYRLPEVHAAISEGKTIYLTEGEKDVESLRNIGKTATCNPGGAGKWKPEYSSMLDGASVVIISDRDEPGRKHAEMVRKSLEGHAQHVWIYQAKIGKDVTDHLEAGFAVDELQPLKPPVRRGIVTARELADRGLEELQFTEADMPSYAPWEAVPVRCRPGRVTALGAYTGDGKTSLAIQGLRRLAEAGVSCGYHSTEMSERDLRNKLVAHKGVPLRMSENPWLLRSDAEVLTSYNAALAEIAQWNMDIVFDSSTNAQKIREITYDREHDVVFVDHIHRFAWGERRKLDEQINALTNLALELNVAVIILCQLRKYQKGKDLVEYPMPTLQDFRETSMIGDDAAMALAIWRQRVNGLQYTGSTQVSMLKNRYVTGPRDRPGETWFPYFDEDRQLLLPTPPQGETSAGN